MENGQKIEPLILALDSAVGVGSVALLRGGKVMATSSPSAGSPARAEEVMQVISLVLSGADTPLERIDRIAVSLGPGSYSGIRIGLATALGLSAALARELVGVSVLDAFLLVPQSVGQFVAAVAVGKRHIGWTAFEVTLGGMRRSLSAPVMNSDEEFARSALSVRDVYLLCDADLVSRVRAVAPAFSNVIDIRQSVAELIGIFAHRYPEKTSNRPIYLRDSTTSGQPVI